MTATVANAKRFFTLSADDEELADRRLREALLAA
jgi:hypothetical protein